MKMPQEARKALAGAAIAAAGALALSPAGEALLKALEGFSAQPYKDEAGVWTDGYGNTKNVRPGVPVTEVSATLALREHVKEFTAAVLKAVGTATQGQLDSYVLLSYNIGSPAFAGSTAVKAHRAGDYTGACLYATRWNKLTENGVLRVSYGLAKRRLQEYDLCIADLPPGAWSNETRGTR